MKINCLTTKRKLSILRVTALVFLLQMVSPAVQAVLASNVEGYTGTVCTMTGQTTRFVPLKSNQEQSGSAYFQCPACIIQASLNGLPEAAPLLVDARYLLDSLGQIEIIYLAPDSHSFPRFLSRAPPA